jgi:hypothetical protein
MKRFIRHGSAMALFAAALILTMQTGATAPPAPNPVLVFIGAESYDEGGKEKIRYRFDVGNKSEYSDDMFAAAPDLPPCGANTKSSRTWVDLYDHRGKKLNGFCALGKSADLDKIWFSLDSDAVPPSWIYIEMVDRKTGTKYKSNLAETTL